MSVTEGNFFNKHVLSDSLKKIRQVISKSNRSPCDSSEVLSREVGLVSRVVRVKN